MISKKEYDDSVQRTLEAFKKASIHITDEEKQNIEVADFGLNCLKKIGLQILTYINTEKVCAKEMVLFPHQTCPEHIHLDGIDDKGVPYVGKEETFRVRKGMCYLYVDGETNSQGIQATLPPTRVTVFKEIVLHEGEQYTLYPNTWHWFQAGKEGAIISEFSTRSRDESDVFRDKRIQRLPVIGGEKHVS